MIDTKEQYEVFRKWMSLRGARDIKNDVSTNDAYETIEALREVARAINRRDRGTISRRPRP